MSRSACQILLVERWYYSGCVLANLTRLGLLRKMFIILIQFVTFSGFEKQGWPSGAISSLSRPASRVSLEGNMVI